MWPDSFRFFFIEFWAECDVCFSPHSRHFAVGQFMVEWPLYLLPNTIFVIFALCVRVFVGILGSSVIVRDFLQFFIEGHFFPLLERWCWTGWWLTSTRLSWVVGVGVGFGVNLFSRLDEGVVELFVRLLSSAYASCCLARLYSYLSTSLLILSNVGGFTIWTVESSFVGC